MAFRSVVLFVLALTVAGSVLYLWSRPRAPVAEGEGDVVPAPPAAPAEASVPPSAAPPAPAEVQPALDRVFEGSVVVAAAPQPPFLAGDFNGDGAGDLAVAVRPRGPDVLVKLNAAVPSWRTQDAAAQPAPGGGRPAPVTIAEDERLLAVVHGSGAAGWRDPSLLQGYLVKNAGAGTHLDARPLAEMPDAVRMNATRVHAGDVIVETRGGRAGVVFWTGAAYAWADLEAAPASARP